MSERFFGRVVVRGFTIEHGAMMCHYRAPDGRKVVLRADGGGHSINRLLALYQDGGAYLAARWPRKGHRADAGYIAFDQPSACRDLVNACFAAGPVLPEDIDRHARLLQLAEQNGLRPHVAPLPGQDGLWWRVPALWVNMVGCMMARVA